MHTAGDLDTSADAPEDAQEDAWEPRPTSLPSKPPEEASVLREQAQLSQGFGLCSGPPAEPKLPWEPHPPATSQQGSQQRSVSSCHS